MRTTLPIDDEVLAAAKALTAERHQSIGEVISTHTRQALRPAVAKGALRNGVPLLPVQAGAVHVALDLVNQLRDELP